MLDAEAVSEIRRLYYAEHWRVGTIAAQLGVHPEAVKGALNRQLAPPPRKPRPRISDPYLPFLIETLERYPRLRSMVLYRMVRERGFPGSVVQLRRVVRGLRPSRREVFTQIKALPGEVAQADWADFGEVMLGRAQRRLSAFVMTLSYSRRLYVEFFFDQTSRQLSARSRQRIRALWWCAARRPDRQSALRRPPASRRADSLSPALFGAGWPLLLSGPPLPRRPRQ
jgi:transposase